LILSFLIGLTLANDAFLQFAKEFGKKYATRKEFSMRQEIFLKNYQEMLEHNALFEQGQVSWARKVTKFYDRTFEEFATEVGLGMPQYDNSTKHEDVEDEAYMEKYREIKGTAPSSWNWVDQGGVSPVKNQGGCGSCAAFAAISVLETCYWQRTGKMQDLSEQHIMDCANGHYYYDDNGAWGAFGCNGAWPQAYFDWLANESNGRDQSEESYPYTGRNDRCKSNSNGNYNGAHVTGMHNKWDVNEKDMKDLVYIAPVATNIQADFLSDYSHGVYDDHRCCEQISDPNCAYEHMNHEITVVGYGHQDGLDYWLVKNSWGVKFGEDGYFKIKRGTGHCGIGSNHFVTALCTSN